MILLIVFIVLLFLWYRKKYALSITLLFFLTCGGLNLKFISNELIALQNYLFIFSNLVLFQDLRKGKLNRDMRNDPFLKLLIYGYLFFIIHCLITILLRQDSFKYAFLVLRIEMSSLLMYVVVRKLTVNEIERTIKYIYVVIFVHSLFYLFQLFGINLFRSEYVGYGIMRNGTPYSLPLYILISWNVLILLLPLVYSEARGVIVSLLISLLVYYRSYLIKIRYIPFIVLISILLTWGYTKYIAENVQRYDISMLEEILKGFDWKTITDFTAYDTDGTHYTFKDNGTFAFRISLILERVFYLILHPIYIPFGVGAIAESSPYNDFNFYIGTENELLKHGIGQIDSVDVVWSSIVLRYGFFGVLFWCLIVKFWYKLFKNNPLDPYFKVGGIYVLFFILNSFGSSWVIHASWLLPYLLIYNNCS